MDEMGLAQAMGQGQGGGGASAGTQMTIAHKNGRSEIGRLEQLI